MQIVFIVRIVIIETRISYRDTISHWNKIQ